MGERLYAWALVAMTGAVVLASPAARAQCGANRSTCSACHDGTSARFAAKDAWHEEHAFADLCAVCHGGHPESQSMAVAHAGLVAPLGDTDARCGSCHGADGATLGGRYRASASGARPSVPAASPTPPAERGAPHASLALAIVVGLLGVLAGALLLRRERVRRAVRAREWSAYAAGAGLGVVAAASMAVFGHRLSGAGAYQALSGYVGRAAAPDAIYWRHVVPTGLTWDVLVLLGGLAGAFASSVVAGTFRVRTMPDRQWADAFGPSVARRWLLAFVGSMLTEIGGGIAGGCTASLAVSGGAALAPGAFLFMAGMFAGGVPLALFVYRRRRG